MCAGQSHATARAGYSDHRWEEGARTRSNAKLRASSAVAVLKREGDPFYQKGLRSFEIHEWIFMEGSMTVTLNFAENTLSVT